MTDDGDYGARLRELRANTRGRINEELRSAIDAMIEELAREQVPRAVAVGDIAPDFDLQAVQTGQRYVLSELLTQGPVVLSFYRGQW